MRPHSARRHRGFVNQAVHDGREFGCHADEADFASLHPLSHVAVQGEALQLRLGQHRPDVSNFVQLQVQGLEATALVLIGAR